MRLTPREVEVCELLVQGMGNTGIAARLTLSKKTVDSHVSNIKERVGINNRVLLALWWHENAGNFS